MFRALVVDDHPLFRIALYEVVASLHTEHEIFEASTLDEARAQVECHGEDTLDLILLDLQIPGATGFSGLVALRRAVPSVPIIIVSAWADDEVVKNAMTYGAAGFIPKSFSKNHIAQGIDRVLSGGIYVPPEPNMLDRQRPDGDHKGTAQQRDFSALTRGELRVLDLLAEGKPNKIIAYELGIKESTVKAHITAILRKLKVHSRSQAILMTRRQDFMQN